MKGFPLFPHSFPPLKGKTLWKAGQIGAPPTLKNTVFHRHTAGTQCLSRTSGQDAPTARATAASGNDCILRSTGESPTEADGKPYCPPTGSTPQRPGTQRLSRLRRGPRQQTAAIVSSAPRGKALQKRDGSFMSHPQGAFCKSRRKSI